MAGIFASLPPLRHGDIPSLERPLLPHDTSFVDDNGMTTSDFRFSNSHATLACYLKERCIDFVRIYDKKKDVIWAKVCAGGTTDFPLNDAEDLKTHVVYTLLFFSLPTHHSVFLTVFDTFVDEHPVFHSTREALVKVFRVMESTLIPQNVFGCLSDVQRTFEAHTREISADIHVCAADDQARDGEGALDGFVHATETGEYVLDADTFLSAARCEMCTSDMRKVVKVLLFLHENVERRHAHILFFTFKFFAAGLSQFIRTVESKLRGPSLDGLKFP